MPDIFMQNPHVTLGSAGDISSKVRSVSLRHGRESIEKTASGDGTRVYMNGLRVTELEITLKEDYAVGALDDDIWALIEAGVAFEVHVRPTTGAISTANPDYFGDFIFDGAVDLISGSVGELQEKTLRLLPAETLTRDVTP